MQPVIAESVAREEIQSWADFYETSISPAEVNNLLPAVMRGRVTFDEETETFLFQLKKPIQLENGTTMDTLTLREPNAKEFAAAMKIKDEMEATIKLVSVISGQAVALIERIKSRDLMALTGLLGFFA